MNNETRIRLMALARAELTVVEKDIQRLGELRKSAKLPDDTLAYFTEREAMLRQTDTELRSFIRDIAKE